jgi:ATP phosphoribosyltransferase regulatory subunit HisZ
MVADFDEIYSSRSNYTKVSEETIRLATTFSDTTLKDVTARPFLTDGEKANAISIPLEITIGVGREVGIVTTSLQ